jgi:molybdopterin synthase sulfur carrier subunit
MHLQVLARAAPVVTVVVDDQATGPVTARRLLDALESVHPELRGTIRDRRSGARRAYMRYFAGGEDLSHEDPDAPLPAGVQAGGEPFRIVGAIAGG